MDKNENGTKLLALDLMDWEEADEPFVHSPGPSAGENHNYKSVEGQGLMEKLRTSGHYPHECVLFS